MKSLFKFSKIGVLIAILALVLAACSSDRAPEAVAAEEPRPLPTLAPDLQASINAAVAAALAAQLAPAPAPESVVHVFKIFKFKTSERNNGNRSQILWPAVVICAQNLRRKVAGKNERQRGSLRSANLRKTVT